MFATTARVVKFRGRGRRPPGCLRQQQRRSLPFGGSSGGQVTLTWFMWSGSDAERDAWLHIADMVTQKYPNIKIQFETTPFNHY